MLNRLRLTPVLSTALGAALGFYCFGSLAPSGGFAVLFAALVLLCFIRALESAAVQSRILQLTSVRVTAFAAGLCIGICAANAGRNVVRFGIPEDKITAIEGVLLEDPRVISGGRVIAALSLRKCAGDGGLRVSSRGEITVFFPEETAARLREFGRGTTVFIEGRLRLASHPGDTGTGRVYSAESMHIVKPASAIERMRTGIRLNLIKRFDGESTDGLSVAGGLALALLVGIRDNLDTNLAAMYRSAGLSYILALSGMHLAVLVSLIAFLLKKPLGLKASAIISAVIICLYCFIVGPMPSLNRAAIMYLLGVLAVLGALPKESMSVLALSFIIQIIISPASGNSLSFILSYIALAGILIVGQALTSLFSGKVPDFLLQPLAVSCGAFLATAGVTCFSFVYLAPAGIIASLVLVPATTVFMIGSMIWLVLDIFSLSGLLNWPLLMLYQLMEKTASLAGIVPGISTARPTVILFLSVALSCLIVTLEYRRQAALVRLRPFS